MTTISATEGLVKPSENLIASSEIKTSWSALHLSEKKGKWIKSPKNAIEQNAETGTRKQGSGTILLWNKPVASNSVELSGYPGTSGQFGLVFNYSSREEFALFFLDQHAGNYQGYHFVVGEVREGSFRILAKDKFDSEMNTNAALRIVTDLGTTRFLINNKVAYESETLRLETGSSFGLYSQGKSNGRFESLTQNLFGVLAMTNGKPQANDPAETPFTATPQSQSYSQAPENGTLLPYLKLQEPKSKTMISFTEVFTVPLDSFYERLYKNPSLNKLALPGILSGTESKVYKLDFRPRRWYMDYKKITEAEAFLETDVQALKGYIKKLEDQLAELASDEAFDKLRNRLSSYRADYGARLEQLNAAREQKSQLLREVRTNGFTIIEGKTPQAILDKGYNFHIIGGQPTERTLTPVPIPYQFDYGNHEQWKEMEEKLKQKLLDSSALSNTQKTKFEQQLAQLANFDSNVKLKQSITTIDSEITQLKSELARQPSATAIEQEKAAWQKDRDMLKAEMIKNPMDYYASDFPAQIDGHTYSHVGTADSSRFYNWLNNGSQKGSHTPHPALSNYGLNTTNTAFKVFSRLLVTVSFAESHSMYGPALVPAFAGIHYPDASISYHRYFVAIAKQMWQVDPTSGSYGGRTNTQPTPGQGPYTTFEYKWGGDRSIGNFFREAIKVCDYYIEKNDALLKALDQTRNKIQNEITIKEDARQAIIDSGLQTERKEFLSYWNNPEAINVKNVTTNIISPDVDPLADLLINLSGNESVNYKTYFFQFSGDGFYNQEGQSLKEFSLASAFNPREALAVVPEFDKNGKVSPEVVNAITNPKPVTMLSPELPIIKFAETYQMEIRWKGYGLGELSQSFNLFPGETKELIIEKSTRQQTKSSHSSTSTHETTQRTSNSFEENMNNEFSDKQSDSGSDTSKTTTVDSNKQHTLDTKGNATEFNFKLSGPAKSFGPSLGMSTKSDWRKTRSDALEKSQTTETQKINNQSRDILQKNVNNTINKVASETSMSNKLEVTASTSYEYEETGSRKETIKIQNPNIGRTINYNFFQLQNIYEITTRLKDVKIVINPGIEVMEGSGMSDIRVFELEEFGKIFVNLDQQDPHSTLLAAIVARQVFRHYADMMPGITTGNGAVKAKGPHVPDQTMLEVLNFSSSPDDPEYMNSLHQRLQTALAQLQKIPFVFNEIPVGDTTHVTVNAAAYYLESELGERPSTEKYLESRRDIETEMQLAGLDHLKAQTRTGVFYPNFSNVNRLTIEGSVDKLKSNVTAAPKNN